MDPGELAEAFKERPALHRYPGSMAGRVQDVCRAITEDYGGQPENIWKGVRSGDELVSRLRALPGFGEQKAKIFAALLGKQLGVRPTGWRAATSPYGDAGSHLSVADITDLKSLEKVRATKRATEGQGARRRVSGRPDLSGRNLYLCTPDRPDLAAFVAACIEGGVDVVQLRDKELEARPAPRTGEGRRRRLPCLRRALRVNDRPDLALEAGADGVHVGQDDAPVSLARRILGPDAIVGLSTHSGEDLTGALGEDVSYLSAGPVEPTPTKPGRPGTGTDYVSLASARASVPVFVTGGVSPEKIPALTAAGVRHFVVVRYLTQAPDARHAARGAARRDRSSVE